jgi:uncharacterized protein (DUF58 family)
MLLTAINYQNSLIYLITFFLGTLFFLSICLCFLNLSGLIVEALEPGRCYEGDQSKFHYRIAKARYLPLALKIGLDKTSVKPIPLSMQECEDLVLFGAIKKRGRHKIQRLYLESRFPFGLVLAWTWLKLDAECWVYPKAIHALPDSGSTGQEEKETSYFSKGDLNDLRSYEQGDSISRILWKKYAATDSLIIRDHDKGSQLPEWVDWSHYSASTEDRLRHLCFDVCQLSEESKPYGFKIPGLILGPDIGELHKRKCLDALALFGL